ncbi:MAG: hypothetical protein HZA22_09750 [Nitrospirae bacterium]|nr:hypothetical protein [Nitrospirota bacterium]MBI5696584.1 hypothetical protein [Nitrospirota bacterium]
MLSPPGNQPGGGHGGGARGAGAGQQARQARPQADEMVQDPECKVYVPLSRAVTREVGGRTMHFCSGECAEKYVKGLRG